MQAAVLVEADPAGHGMRLQEGLDRGAAFLGHGDEDHGFAREACAHLVHVGEGLAADPAPGGQELQHHRLAAQLALGDRELAQLAQVLRLLGLAFEVDQLLESSEVFLAGHGDQESSN